MINEYLNMKHLMKKNFKRILLFFIIVFYPFVATHSHERDFAFRHLSMENGLSSNTVYSIVQDDKGFLWFGTRDGFIKYDGKVITTFKHDPLDSNSVASNNCGNLYYDSKGFLWIGMWGKGLDRYDPNNNTFIHYRHDPENPNTIADDRIQSIFEDSFGTMWFSTFAGGLSRLDEKDRATGRFTTYVHNKEDKNSISHNRVRNVAEDENKNLWISTNYGFSKLSVENREKGIFNRFYLGKKSKNKKENICYRTYFDLSGNLWIGKHNGAFRISNPNTISNFYNKNNITFYTFKKEKINSPNNNQAYIFHHDRDGRFWIGMDGGGLIKLDPTTGSYMRFLYSQYDKKSISGNRVRWLMEDRSKNLWIGTLNNGISVLDLKPKFFNHFINEPGNPNSLINNNVNAILKDKTGTLWVATQGGLSSITTNKDGQKVFKNYKYNPNNSDGIPFAEITSICEDSSGNIWLGGRFSGLVKLDRESDKFRVYVNISDQNSLSDNDIYSLLTSKYEGGNTIWIGTDYGGLNKFDIVREEFTHFRHNPENPNSIPHDAVKSIMEDSKGNLWIGTHNGLSVWYREKNNENEDSIKFVAYKHNPNDTLSIISNRIHYIYETSDQTIWIGTLGGLSKIIKRANGKIGFINYSVADGLPNNVVVGILEDDEKNLWISTENGLSKFDINSKKFSNYSEDHGLQGNKFLEGSCYKSLDGELFFGGTSGLNNFYPEKVKLNNYLPNVVLTDFKVFNKSKNFQTPINDIKSITIPYQENIFTIEFAALEFTDSKKNQFAYKLTGFNENWINIGNNNQATFTNLDPGEYIFTVKASNNDGVWNEKGASLQIIIVPPFWKTTWFKIGSVLAIVFLFFIVYKVRTKNIRKHYADLEKEISERRLAEIALKESEERFSAITKQSSEGIALATLEGDYVFVNPAFCEMMGYSNEELLNMTVFDMKKNKGDEARRKFEKSKSNKEGTLIEIELERKDKSTFPSEILGKPIKVGNKELILGIITDITERKKSEMEIRNHIKFLENLERVDSVIRTSKNLDELMKNVIETIFTIFDSDRAWLLYPCDPEASSWKIPVEITKPEYPGALAENNDLEMTSDVKKLFQLALSLNEPLLFDPNSSHTEPEINKEFGIRSQIVMAINPRIGKPWMFGLHQCSFDRIWTDHEKRLFENIGNRIAEALSNFLFYQSLKESEEKYRQLIEKSNDAVYLLMDKHFEIINPRFTEMFGYKLEEVNRPSFNFIQLVAPKSIHIIEERIEKIKKGEKLNPIYEFTAITKEGKEIDCEVSTSIIEYKDGTATQGIIRDITERKKAEEKILQLSRAVEQTPVSIVITDINGNIEYVNPKFTEVTSYSFDEALGQNPKLLKSGEQSEGFYQELWETISSGNVWSGEFHNKRKNGDFFWESAIISPIKDKEGKVTHFVAIKEDITEKKEMINELIKTKEKAEKADRLKSTFLAQMSHEIRTPINTLVSMSSILRYDFEESADDDQLMSFDIIDRAGGRIIRTVDLLLNLSEIQTGSYEPHLTKFDIFTGVISQIVAENKILAKSKNIDLNLIYSVKNSELVADHYTVNQIFTQLIDNAIKYTNKGEVNVKILRNHSEQLVVEIEDTGIGIEEEYLAKIFEPFTQEEMGYTRKYEGNGIGLALVKTYCELNKAKVEVESSKGVGSTFRVVFES